MKLNLEGRVKNISENIISYEPYMPLYEAIINSIESIEESDRNDGEIEGDVRKRLEELKINSINKFISGEFISKVV